MKVEIIEESMSLYSPKSVIVTFYTEKEERIFRHLIDCSTVGESCPYAAEVKEMRVVLLHSVNKLDA